MSDDTSPARRDGALMTQDNGQTYSLAKRPLHQLTEAERATIAHAVLDRYINGEQVADIAPSFDVSDVTIYALLLREHQDAWKDIQTARALARLERAQDALATLSDRLDSAETAFDALSLARIREQTKLLEVKVKSAQWELERLLKRLYATAQEITGAGGGVLQVEIVRYGAQTIEGEAQEVKALSKL